MCLITRYSRFPPEAQKKKNRPQVLFFFWYPLGPSQVALEKNLTPDKPQVLNFFSDNPLHHPYYFHYGNFEGIGVHHHKSQTLYLSELIEVPHCKNPSYFKLHIGLYMAAIWDCIDPVAQQSKTEVTNGRLKHSDGYLANRSSKKCFFNDVPAEINKHHKKSKAHERMNVKENQKDRSQRTEVCPGFHTYGAPSVSARIPRSRKFVKPSPHSFYVIFKVILHFSIYSVSL